MDLETLMVILPNSYFAEEGIKSQSWETLVPQSIDSKGNFSGREFLDWVLSPSSAWGSILE